MKLLNPGYESETVGGSLYWNSGTGSCYGYDYSTETLISIPCNFTNKGLSTNAKNNIEAVKWNLGGWNNHEIYSNQIYGYERGNNVVIPGTTCTGNFCNDSIQRTTLWTGRVALAYPSDYGYAVDLNNCSSNLKNYKNCTTTNWMFNTMTANGNSWSWLLTPGSRNAYGAWCVATHGGVSDGNFVYDIHGVSPVFYLDSELTVESGTGTSDDPYVLW